MIKSRKKLISIYIILTFLVISFLSVTVVFALQKLKSDSSVSFVYSSDGVFTYVLNSDEASWTLSELNEKGIPGEIVVPSEHEGLPVNAIGSGAFIDARQFDTVTIPETIETIGDSAFFECFGLKTVVFEGDSKLKSIGNDAFFYTAITEFNIPETVTSIGEYAFSGTKLINITTPSGVTSIADYTFYECVDLIEVVFLGDVENIGTSSFADCQALQEITIPSSVTLIGTGAFQGCSELVNVLISEDSELKIINDNAFQDCVNLVSIYIPSNVNSLGKNAFNSCLELENVVFDKNSSLKTISDSAFISCYSLQSITIPTSVQSIENDAFGQAGLYDVTFKETSELKNIGEYAFYCTYITEITIPASVEYIGPYAFKDTQLNSVTFEKTNDWGLLERDAAYPMQRVSVTDLSQAAIDLTTTYVDYHWEGNFSLNALITTDNGDGTCYISGYDEQILDEIMEGIIHIPEENYNDLKIVSIADSVFKSCDVLTTITIPATITSIGYRAFWISSLMDITITENSQLTTIGNEAFYGCKFTAFTFPNSIKSIGENAFSSCKITNIELPEGLATIGEGAFGWNNSLTSISLPSTLTSVGRLILASCENLNTINVANGRYYYGSSNALIETNTKTLIAGCNSTEKIPEDVLIIGERAFQSSVGLTTINLPSTLQTIETYAFGDSGLSGAITIPKNVTNIQDYAFYNTKITNVIFEQPLDWGRKGDYDTNYIRFTEDLSNSATAATCLKSTYRSYDWKANISLDALEFALNSNGTYDVTYCVNSKIIGNLIVVPKEFNGVKVEGIDGAFDGCTNLNNIIMQNTLTTIGDSAFNGCTGLTVVTIPSSVTSIGNSAFKGCTGLTSINIPYGVKKISSQAFKSCQKLTAIRFPSTVEKIGVYAFDGAGLTSAIFDNTTGWFVAYSSTATSGTSISVVTTSTNATNLKSTHSAKWWLRNVSLDALTFTLNSAGTEYSVSDCDNSKLTTVNGEVIIPETYNSKPVTSIGANAFESCGNLISVNIPTSISEIGASAFKSCSNLTTVTIPNTVSSISSNTFYGCSALTSITIPDSIISIWNYAFASTGLTSIVIPENVVTIGMEAFGGTRMSSVTFNNPNGWYYANSAVTQASSGTSIDTTTANNDLVTWLTSTYSNKFWLRDDSLDGVIFEDVAEDGTLYVYSHIDTKLAKVNGVITIPEMYNGKQVVAIDYSAFNGSGALTSITIPSNITKIGHSAFYYATALKNVIFTGYATASALEIERFVFAGCTSLTSITIPSCIKTFGREAFSGCTSLQSVTFETGSQLTNIIGGMFINCTNLSSINIPSSVTEIGASAFENCSSLTSINIDSNIMSIGISAFSGTGLTSVSSNNTGNGFSYYEGWVVESGDDQIGISSNDFNSLASLLKETYVDYTWTRYHESEILIYDGNSVIGINNAILKSYDGVLQIPSRVTSLASNMFRNNTLLTEVTFDTNNNLEDLGGGFYNCSNLTNVTFGSMKNLTSIGSFYQCKKLVSVNIPDSVTTIKAQTFYWCESLTSITIPSRVTSIGYQAFKFCRALETVTFNGTNLQIIGNEAFSSSGIVSISIPEGVKTIGDSAFRNCDELESISFPSTVTSIGTMPLIFCTSLTTITVATGNSKYKVENNCLIDKVNNILIAGCNVSNVDIPDDIVRIEDRAFQNCSNIPKTITIPSSVTYIGWYTFYGTGVTYIYFEDSLGWYAVSDKSATTGTTLTSTNATSYFRYYWKKYTALDALTFTENEDGTYSVSGYNEAFFEQIDGKVKIPDLYNGRSVTGILANTFKECAELKEVFIPNSIESIGSYAFMSSGVTNVTFEDGSNLEKLSIYTFDSCKSLINIDFGENASLKYIAMHAISNCTSLKSIILPESVEELVQYTFDGCTNLQNVQLNEGLIEIGMASFRNCSALTSIIIPSTVEFIDGNVFTGCTSLTSISVTSVNEKYSSEGNCLIESDGYQKTIITGLKNSKIPTDEDIRIINNSAFRGCGLTSITIPSNIIKIEFYAFADCDLSTVYFENADEWYITNVGENEDIATDLDLDNKTSEKIATELCSDYEAYNWNRVLGLGVNLKDGDNKYIDGENTAFVYSSYGNYYGEVIIPSIYRYNNKEYQVVRIISAFTRTNVTKVTIPDSIYYINSAAFLDCDYLTDVVFKNREGWQACNEYNNDEEGVYFYANNLSDTALVAEYLKLEYWFAYHTWYKLDKMGVLTFGMVDGHMAVTGFTDKIKYYPSIVIPETYEGAAVSKIANKAFENCTTLKSITISSVIKIVGEFAFTGCSSLGNVHFEGNGQNLETIGKGAFSECSSLGSIKIPNTLKAIAESTFYGCSNLTDVEFAADSKVMVIGRYAFTDCKKLEYIKIPSSVEMIQSFTFSGCSNLITVEFEEGSNLTTINDRAFASCTNLKAFTIQEKVKYIGEYAFIECGLKNVTFINSSGWKAVMGSTIINFNSSTYNLNSGSNNALYLRENSSYGGYSNFKWSRE